MLERLFANSYAYLAYSHYDSVSTTGPGQEIHCVPLLQQQNVFLWRFSSTWTKLLLTKLAAKIVKLECFPAFLAPIINHEVEWMHSFYYSYEVSISSSGECFRGRNILLGEVINDICDFLECIDLLSSWTYVNSETINIAAVPPRPMHLPKIIGSYWTLLY